MGIELYKSTIDNYTLVREPTIIPKAKISCSTDIAKYILDNMYNEDIWECESLGIITLNQAHNTKGYKILSKGGINCTIADVRLMFKYVLDSLGTGFVMFHNHPSQNPTPSKADIELYKRCKQIADIFQIAIVDCIIVCPSDEGSLNYYSFADKGIL